jgi:type IV pilus assembly protein PilM
MQNVQNVLSNALSFLNSVFKRRGAGSVVGIDFGSSAIKAVQLRKKNEQAVLETYGSVALGPYAGIEAGRATRLSQEKLIEALKDVLREAKITATNAGCAVPLSASLIAAIEVPRPLNELEQKNQSSIVRIEAQKYIPTPLSEVEFEWRELPSSSPGKTNALISAIHRDALERLHSFTSSAELVSKFFEIEIWSLIRAEIIPPDAIVGFIDIGASFTKVAIVDNGILRDVHLITRGGQNITIAVSSSLGISAGEAELKKRSGEISVNSLPASSINSIFLEAREVFQHYEKRAGRAIGKIILSGGGALLKGLPATAGRVFGMPVYVMSPLEKLSVPAFLSPLLQNAGPEFAVATGVALRMLEES